MGIKLDMYNGEVIAYQEAFLPMVYLDTWAYIDIGLDKNLKSKFINILNKKKGTLLISDYILYEICKLKFEVEFNIIIDLVEQVDQVFIDLNPRFVIDRENVSNFHDNNFVSPACPPKMLKAFIEDPSINTLRPFNLVDAFKIIRNNPKAIKDLNSKLNFEKMLIPDIIACRNNNKCFYEATKRHNSKKKLNKKEFPHTEDLYRQFMDFLIVNKNMKMPDTEWIDAFHTIVPTAYSDFILLDNRWKEFINSSKLEPLSIAKVYSSQNLDDFFRDLQDFDSADKENILKNLIENKLKSIK